MPGSSTTFPPPEGGRQMPGSSMTFSPPEGGCQMKESLFFYYRSSLNTSPTLGNPPTLGTPPTLGNTLAVRPWLPPQACTSL